ncbi:MAG: serine hydrolase domain-containing protein [Planctomycetota bacterium]
MNGDPTKQNPITEFLRTEVEKGRIPGAVAIVVHDEEVAYFEAFGHSDVEASRRMEKDTIFRIASMTKPITSVAAMMLIEEERLHLSDPIAKYIPAFDRPVVVRGKGNVPVPARTEITVQHLLTHTSGLTYGVYGQEPLDSLYQEARISIGVVETEGTIGDMAGRLGVLPLLFSPGDAWQYGTSTDVLGRVIEVASGMSLDDFFRTRIFDPLGMRDTHFFLPHHKVPRLARLYRSDASLSRLTRVPDGPQRIGKLDYSATYPCEGPRTYFAGGAGLVSTASDYARFLRMLLDGGEFEGSRLLKRTTVKAMTRNQIGELKPFGLSSHKFGFGFLLVSEKADNGASVGTYYYSGGFNTYFWVDPTKRIVGVILVQILTFPDGPAKAFRDEFQKRVYDSMR